MVDIRFHIRNMGDPSLNDGYRQYLTVDGNNNMLMKLYDVSQEIFVLYPDRYDGTNYTTITKLNDYTDLYDFRVAGGSHSTTYPYDLNFGDIDTSTAETLFMRIYTDPGVGANSPAISLETTGAWNSLGLYTVGDYDTFKNEVTNILAKSIDNSRALTGSNVQPMAHYDDWAVQIFLNQDWYDNAAKVTLVIFYPGNDPEADEIITEVI